MNKNKALKIVNPLLGLLLAFQAVSGILQVFFEHESEAGEMLETLHVVGGSLLVIGVIIHFSLNWGWVKSQFCKKKKPAENRDNPSSETEK